MEKGLVIKSIGNSYKVRLDDGRIISCNIKGNLRLKDIKTTNPVAVGDWVEFTSKKNPEFGIISGITERRNYIIRRATNLSKQYHIIAANVDMAYVMATIILPEISTTFIDRVLATAEAYRIPATIIFNKIDLYDEEILQLLAYYQNIYEKAGYPCIKISALKMFNIDLLKEHMKDRVNLLVGQSGVGKSLLINMMQPEFNLKIGDISHSHLKGKHTTTFAEMFELANGGYIIDTPGLKAFGAVDMEKGEIYHFFPEIFRISNGCQYYNCMHTGEPNCAVKTALGLGEISESRYISYLGMLEEDKKYR
ncbi:MAG: ribosome small subunit-dependent GTPase A [Bacteroidia bacterium]|nr:ribosome small subunit-dependent GTPase A [Bacteroidia bacterium]